jgi:hypothetical protein
MISKNKSEPMKTAAIVLVVISWLLPITYIDSLFAITGIGLAINSLQKDQDTLSKITIVVGFISILRNLLLLYLGGGSYY